MMARLWRHYLISTILIFSLLGMGSNCQAADGKARNVIRIGTDYDIAADTEQEGNVIVFGGNISLAGSLKGKAIAIGGNVRISGHLWGDVTAVGGRVVLLRGARITGNVNGIGGGVERSENVELCGEVNSISLAQGLQVPHFHLSPLQLNSLLGYSLYLLGLYLTVLAVGYLFPDQTKRASTALSKHPWRSLGVGLLSSLLFLPISLLLLISIIGRPLILVLVLGFLLAKILGYVATAVTAGDFICRRLGMRGFAPVRMAVGVFSLGLLRSIPWLGIISGVTVFLLGLGAALISRLGAGGTWFSLQRKGAK